MDKKQDFCIDKRIEKEYQNQVDVFELSNDIKKLVLEEKESRDKLEFESKIGFSILFPVSFYFLYYLIKNY